MICSIPDNHENAGSAKIPGKRISGHITGSIIAEVCENVAHDWLIGYLMAIDPDTPSCSCTLESLPFACNQCKYTLHPERKLLM
jgi:hypothetical protein